MQGSPFEFEGDTKQHKMDRGAEMGHSPTPARADLCVFHEEARNVKVVSSRTLLRRRLEVSPGFEVPLFVLACPPSSVSPFPRFMLPFAV